eukprot:CAMPEP_0197280058 /NCGR_PEP_ID=MMETSP1432-20130617/20979_1 /TAXON_ID=44447 /ORGANISM="Pseudo-nitzschia delicatissima, Strain UNC1205" /LENGTH=322 /DNA_ID=CAMNT_0042746683 /DNA_START=66 /DNA_END=1034 /DNA_ORIENTATION=-
MNFLRSFQKDQNKTKIVGENDDGSRYFDGDELSEYENSIKKAAEMEIILGNALAMHERDNGSIHSLERYGSYQAIEMGQRIATMNSREELAASHTDSYDFGSRTSSLGSAASLPTFVRVQREDSMLLRQKSWDEEKYEEPQNLEAVKLTSTRTWSKLRREFDEESRAKYDVDGEEGPRCTQAIENKARDLKKVLRDSSNRGHGLKQRKPSESIRRGFARDYDVEVTLKNKKNFWERQPSILKKLKQKRNKNAETESTDVNTSNEAPKTEETALTEQDKNNVVVCNYEMHKGDVLFQALEVACCASVNTNTLDLITEMVPPHL